MKINLIYLISLAAAFGLLLFWKVYRLLDVVTRRTIIQYARKKLLYTLIYRRRASSDNVNVLSLFNICLILAANVTACGLKINNRAELAKRCGSLFLVNLIPLLLGGQRSFLTDRFLHLQSSEQSLLHRWMGRVCVAQGLVHGIVNATSSSPATLQILVRVQFFSFHVLTKEPVHIIPGGFGNSIISLHSPARLRDIPQDAFAVRFSFGRYPMVPRPSQTSPIYGMSSRRIRTLDCSRVCLVRPTRVS
jgi:hypothetical protein